jgi:hypothetical protein
MSKVINITDKLSKEKPSIQIGNKIYTVDDTITNVLKFEELANTGTSAAMVEAIALALGSKAAKELNVEKMSIQSFKVLATAVIAAMQDMEYEEAAARFQKK